MAQRRATGILPVPGKRALPLALGHGQDGHGTAPVAALPHCPSLAPANHLGIPGQGKPSPYEAAASNATMLGA